MLHVVATAAILFAWASGVLDVAWTLGALTAVLAIGLFVSLVQGFAEDGPARHKLAAEAKRSFPLVAAIAVIAVHEAAFGLGPQWLQAAALLVLTVAFFVRAKGLRSSSDEVPRDADHGPF